MGTLQVPRCVGNDKESLNAEQGHALAGLVHTPTPQWSCR